MSVYLGDFAEDATVHFIWASYDSSGASVTRATDGTVSVYKDNGTTQSTAGVTDTEDFDTLTGIHACTIDTSADAFYATGANYTVVLSAATIDGQTVNAVLAHFSVENRTAFPKADYPTNFADLAITASTGRVTAGTVSDKTGYALTTAERNSIADALLKRDWTSVSGEAARSVLNALRFLRNKWSISGTTLTVTQEDDSTEAWTSTLTEDADANPVTGSDPA